MKTVRRVLIIGLAVLSIVVFVLYILAFILNATLLTEDFFRTYVPKTILLGMCVLGAADAALLIADDRKKQLLRWQKKNLKKKRRVPRTRITKDERTGK